MEGLGERLEKTFQFSYGAKEKKQTISGKINLPLQETITECCHRLMSQQNFPCFLEDELKKDLIIFVEKSKEKISDEYSESVTNTLDDSTEQRLISEWCQSFSEETKEHSKPEEISNELVFSEIYNQLIHSQLQTTILKLENSYARAVDDLISRRNVELNDMRNRQSAAMDKLATMGSRYTDEEINRITHQQFEKIQMLESKWESELTALYDKQRREYREWLLEVHQDLKTGNDLSHLLDENMLSSQSIYGQDNSIANENRLEESFTIHLGAQLKTTHNLRLVRSNILDLCKYSNHGHFAASPIRLQNSMSLYSNAISAMVLIVDDRLNSYFGIKQDFKMICQDSTEFHWNDFDKQLEDIKTILNGKKLQPGDCYVTRHSNLSNVQVVFHLVTDMDTLKTGDVSSRHPVLLGYRNIIRTCFQHDITSLTLPLLLVQDVTEQMTISWCMKRSELVFKCIKGFLMELSTWSAKQSRTVTFLVPNGISQNMFSDISNLLESIFRMSNPVVVSKA
ncbi:unnamed protein product [Dimorphilus gyrociliatus]|uniref:Uncharacterized protein n=1 Tax=Dimorphilus gyrociliatus TaxID=2664684 RepID=A0A7I8W433_9ANNE|nr:unnamed protein product [Dimorphilus gyrociliatus]